MKTNFVEWDYDFLALIFMIVFNTFISIIIASIYGIYKFKEYASSKKKEKQRIDSPPFGALNDSEQSNDFSPLKQPLMDDFK